MNKNQLARIVLSNLMLTSASAMSGEMLEVAATDQAWVASFYWSPQYCHEHRTSREQQCKEPNGFVINSFARIGARDANADCQSANAPPQDLVPQLMRVMLNRPQMQINWDRFGRCSGHSDVEYAAYLEFVDRYIEWPALVSTESGGELLALTDLTKAITDNNPTLPIEAMSFQCNRDWLQLVEICLNQDLRYDGSNCQTTSNCKNMVRVRPYQPLLSN